MAAEMRVLLLGASGQVGKALSEALRVSDGFRLLLPGMFGHDVRFDQSPCFKQLLEDANADVVINAAAYTLVDAAESNRELAFQVNAVAVGELAMACRKFNVPLVHYSTDYVFDGRKSVPYLPSDVSAPLSVYGESKLAGEALIRESGVAHLILRTSWVYGTGGRNFMRTMLSLASKDSLRVVNDQVGAPTPAWLIADVTARILKTGISGSETNHVVARGETSWAGFADAIFDEAIDLGLITSRPDVVGIPTSDYPTAAVRPAYSGLDTSALRTKYGLELPDWRDALRKTLQSA